MRLGFFVAVSFVNHSAVGAVIEIGPVPYSYLKGAMRRRFCTLSVLVSVQISHLFICFLSAESDQRSC